MPLQQTTGNVTTDAYGGGVAAVPNYIEDVFSTYLYNGNEPNSVTVNNGIDLSTKGGLVWIKARETAKSNWLWDTVRGTGSGISSNTTGAAVSFTGVSAFNTNGFTVGSDSATNDSTRGMVSWTFRKQPKFFDVVTYTGNGTTKTISHSLGSVPGCIIVKDTSSTMSWVVYHRSNGNDKVMYLNGTQAVSTDANVWNSYTPTATDFQVGGSSFSNSNGDNYVAYIFAHNAGGFGLTGTDNVISCGSFTTDGSGNATVNLGYEPQWVLWKKSDDPVNGYSNWQINDNMRGFTTDQGAQNLYANSSSAESSTGANFGCSPTSTGFKVIYEASKTYIYIAIRRGPMKVPTSGTSVYTPVAYTGNGSTRTYSVGFPTDISINMNRNVAGDSPTWNDRLRGSGFDLYSNSTGSEQNNGSAGVQFDNQTNIVVPSYRITNGTPYIDWCMRRAPSFFDEVCYTGNGSTQTITHNLGVVPELIIAKNRGQAGNNWPVLFNFASTTMNYGFLNLTNSCPNDTYANVGVFSASPTATSMFLINSSSMNASGYGIVAYLFASCPGVSKVGSYTGNGSTQTINCGFTGGARFVLIKRTDAAGDWYVYDTARGMTTLTDPYLLLNSTAAESATLGSVTTVSTGFAVNASILAAINTNAASYIFLAIA